MITPALLGARAPTAAEIVAFSERQYEAFCHAFREASTEEALRHDPARTAVLVNDISEGPDFARLAAAGFHSVTVYHVDVVAYIAAIYLRGRIAPATLARWWERLAKSPLRQLAPSMLSLIFDQQRASLHSSSRVVVPSAEMREILLECYPETPPERVAVLPWGYFSNPTPEPVVEAEAAALRREFGIEDNAHVVLTLSRISPEKGQDFLLEALRQWEWSEAFPREPVWLLICGAPAFMQGERYLRRLHSLAARLRRVKVLFPGYVTGARKAGLLRLADVYVFPSQHESYGLTLVEALGAGLPALCRDHSGARQILRPEFGVRVVGSGAQARAALLDALQALLEDSDQRRKMGCAAREWATSHPFQASAAQLARWLVDR
jgi:glycosyltransferase involved in cell wall biosynthesis